MARSQHTDLPAPSAPLGRRAPGRRPASFAPALGLTAALAQASVLAGASATAEPNDAKSDTAAGDSAPSAIQATAAPEPHGRLPQAVAALLPELTLKPSQVSAYVRRVDAERPLLAVDAARARIPASTIKLVTSIAALDLLGPEHRWRTEVLISGDIIAGTLEGDLGIKGYGDPYLGTEAFAGLIRAVRAKGIRHIAGDVILDNSHLAAPTAERGDFDGAAQRSYNALPAALSLNRQVTDIVLYNDRARGGVGVYTDPPLSQLTIDNNAELIQAPCRGRHHRLSVRFDDPAAADTGDTIAAADTSGADMPGAGDIGPPEPAPAQTLALPAATPAAAAATPDAAPSAPKLTVTGSFAGDCADERIPRLILSPQEHAAGAFDALWREAGGTIDGRVLAAPAPAEAEVFHRVDSKPLHDVLRRINKWSDNLMARLVFLALGAEHAGAPGSKEKARAALDAWLGEHGFGFPELMVDNGSGLSRDTRLAAASLGELLAWAYHQPWMPELMASMAVMGMDGTLTKRMRSEPIAGRAHMKSGTLRDASCLAGYVLDPDGRRWVVVALVNARPGQRLAAWHGHAVHHALLRWLMDGAALP
ncbi:D-alanyl-D-alanine carboxypeptidase/D-alanyl-D-alanine-endopeptidase [Thiohalocapsa halophila]|uniref:D-alanyl-D-alanine carboxypeptidase/D-alanyl-D-alanine-endopeptidase n=1 Tax=Thiohalocapsa halophila TaxID=69359 RepID=A0ABS1CNZ1_9GAMM|nr:D-alanyl-D-alanine carboxypeptidase/D-alanyl-D-alanine-endopeptidase [Thiohalocapsa halophila]MBK1633664.1 D-alanyl-D-alanine carboxypeptidase/D-alanyl-D-alanine-endopeptidase [Thiohalocapsa halophila]